MNSAIHFFVPTLAFEISLKWIPSQIIIKNVTLTSKRRINSFWTYIIYTCVCLHFPLPKYGTLHSTHNFNPIEPCVCMRVRRFRQRTLSTLPIIIPPTNYFKVIVFPLENFETRGRYYHWYSFLFGLTQQATTDSHQTNVFARPVICLNRSRRTLPFDFSKFQ